MRQSPEAGAHMEASSVFVKPHDTLKTAVEHLIENDSAHSELLSLEAGEYLFREGEDVRQTFFIKRGLIKLSSESSGGYAKTVFMHKTGTLLGFQGFQELEDRKPAILNAKAATKSTIVAIDGSAFDTFLKNDGEACYAMAQYLFSMLSLQTRESVNSSIYSILQRFAALLCNLAKEVSTMEEPALIPFSNAELAEMLGVHVNSATGAITSLRRAGCIDKQRGYLAIIDFAKLRSIAIDLIAG